MKVSSPMLSLENPILLLVDILLKSLLFLFEFGLDGDDVRECDGLRFCRICARSEYLPEYCPPLT